MTILLFSNNAKSTLASAISSTATTATLASGTGSLFPSPTTGQGFKMTFVDSATGLLNEIVLVTQRTGDIITIVRGQEGTTPQSWLANDLAGMYFTAGTINNNIQLDQYQIGTYDTAIATGSANSLSATIPSNLNYIPTNFTFTLQAIHANTGSATLNLTIGTTATGIYPIVKSNNQPLIAGDIANVGYPMLLAWSPVYSAYVLLNPATGESSALNPSQLQQQLFTYGVATGGSDTIAVTVPSSLTLLTDGFMLMFKAAYANGTATPNLTLTLGSTATPTATIVKGDNLPLSSGDIAGAGFICEVVYSTSLNKWVLLNPYPNFNSLGSMAFENNDDVQIYNGVIHDLYEPLPVHAGGLGVNSLTTNTVLISTVLEGSPAVVGISPSNVGQCLRSDGTHWYSSQVGLGISGETWHDVLSSRSVGTTYTNSRTYPIFVFVSGGAENGFSYTAIVNGVTIGYGGNQTGAGGVNFIVPTGQTYSIAYGGNPTSPSIWQELY